MIGSLGTRVNVHGPNQLSSGLLGHLTPAASVPINRGGGEASGTSGTDLWLHISSDAASIYGTDEGPGVEF